jgi:hypothetical protein
MLLDAMAGAVGVRVMDRTAWFNSRHKVNWRAGLQIGHARPFAS